MIYNFVLLPFSGNKNWYSKMGDFFDKFNYFFFGYIDYHLDPYSR